MVSTTIVTEIITKLIGSEKKTQKEKKHVNTIFTGLSRDFGANFVYVFFLPHRE